MLIFPRSRRPRYRLTPFESAEDPRVMARPVGGGRYAERVVGPDGRIEGFGDNRDYAPLAPPVRRPLYDPDSEPIRPVAPVVTPVPPVDAGPPPLVTSDRRGRPQIMGGLPEPYRLPAERQLVDQLRAYEPQKRSRLRMIGLSALRGLAAGPGGAISGALFGAGTALLDPTAEDRAWRDRQLAESQQRQAELRGEQRLGLQDKLLEAQVAETQAQAEARRNPRPKLIEMVQPDGTVVLAPEREGVVTGRPKAPPPSYSVDIPGYGRVEGLSPDSVTDYFGQMGRREDEQAAAERTREQKYAAAQTEYDSLLTEEEVARVEKDRAYQVLSTMRQSPTAAKEDVAQAEQAAQSADKIYQSYAEKKRDAQRRLQENQGGRSRTSLPSAPPPPPGVTEASIRAEAKRRGASEEVAVQRARGFGWIP